MLAYINTEGSKMFKLFLLNFVFFVQGARSQEFVPDMAIGSLPITSCDGTYKTKCGCPGSTSAYPFWEKDDRAKVSIDGIDLPVKWLNSYLINGISVYNFTENELVDVSCSFATEGAMKMNVKGQGDLVGPINGKAITLLMKMRREPKGKYIECSHNNTTKTVVRINLKPKQIVDSQIQWKVRINDVSNDLKRISTRYRYVKGEEVDVSCEKITQDTKLITQRFIHRPNTLINVNNITCTNVTVAISFLEIYTIGLQGLRSSNIIFLYETMEKNLIIHYEYQDKDKLLLLWRVEPLHCQRHDYTVFWKNNPITTVPITTNSIEKIITIPTITINKSDDGGIIKFWITSNCGGKTLRRETLIVLRMKTINDQFERETSDPYTNSEESTQGNTDTSDYSVYYGIAGGCFVILLIILLLVIYLMKRQKQDEPMYESELHSANHRNGSIDPNSSQLDSALEETKPDTDGQDLYSKPMPKSLRCGKIPDENYAQIVFSSTPSLPTPKAKELYSEILHKNPFNKKGIEEECYANIEPFNGGNENQ